MKKQTTQIDNSRPDSLPAQDDSLRYNLTIPKDLIVSLRDNALAIGLYCLIVRQFVIYRNSIPFSDADITVYDPTLARSSVTRAFQRLVDNGWAVRSRHGNKNTYHPAWGRIRGVTRIWQFGQPLLNRPRHLQTIPFDKRMLDIYFGCPSPHPHLPLTVERYSAAPVLGLRDVGAYLLTQVGFSKGTAALNKCGLVHEGIARQLPAESEILARISQQNITDDDAPPLTVKGLRRLGIEVAQPEQPAETGGGQLLVFLPPNTPGLVDAVLAGLTRRLPGSEGQKTWSETEGLPALGADNCSSNFENENFTCNNMKIMNKHESTTMGVAKKEKKSFENRPEPIPNTLTAQELLEIGVRPSVVRELCHEDLDYVKRIIIQGRLNPNVRCLAAWTVAAIRERREPGGYSAPSVPRNGDLDLEKYTTGEYAGWFDSTPAAAEEEIPLKDQAEPEVVMEWIKSTLCGRFSRAGSLVVLNMRLLEAGEVPVVGCASADDLAAIEGNLDYHIAKTFQEFGWANAPRFVLMGDGLARSDQPGRSA